MLIDTHIIIFAQFEPHRLSKSGLARFLEAERQGLLACADISIWEIAMLLDKKRLETSLSPEVYLQDLFTTRNIKVLPIVPGIALLSQTHPDLKNHKDPADRLIVATALHHHLPLMSLDGKLQKIGGLEVFH